VKAPRPRRNPRVVAGEYMGALALTVLVFNLILVTVAFGWGEALGFPPVMQDFHAFHVTGGMVWDGVAAEAYAEETLRPVQERETGVDAFMPWTYPPTFNLIAAALAVVPDWVAYPVFAGGGILAYALVLRALAGRWSGWVHGAMLPAMVICVSTGQNGLWVGAVAGLVVLLAGRGAVAGLPLALLTLKPHMLPAIGLVMLLRAEMRAILAGIAGAALMVAAATLVMGVGIWPAFLGGVAEAAVFLREGAYKFTRMTSVYAGAHAMGAAPGLAMALQVGVALTAMGGLVLAWWRGWPMRRLMAAAMFATPFLSPYAYDYDLAVVGIGLALVIPEIAERAGVARLLLCQCLAWAAVVFSPLVNILGPWPDASLSIGAPMLVLLAWAALSGGAGTTAPLARGAP
jgi:hypothetical protein